VPCWGGPSEHRLLEDEGEGGLSGAELSDASNAAQALGSPFHSVPGLDPGLPPGLAPGTPGVALGTPGMALGTPGVALGIPGWTPASTCRGRTPPSGWALLRGSEQRTPAKEEGMDLDSVWDDLDFSGLEVPESKEGEGLFGGVTAGGSGPGYNDTTQKDAAHSDMISASNEHAALSVQEAQSPFRSCPSAATCSPVPLPPGDLLPLGAGDPQGGGGGRCTPLPSSVDPRPGAAWVDHESPHLNMEAGVDSE